MKRKVVSIGITFVLLLSMIGCATHKSCPTCSTETLWLLNVSSELKLDNDNYQTFFKDAGSAFKAGQITAAQLTELNDIGHVIQRNLGVANALLKTYAVNQDADTKTKIINVLVTITQLLGQLGNQKTIMMLHPTGGVK